MTHEAPLKPLIAERFRGFLPVVVDVETGGFNATTDALLEIAAVTLTIDATGQMVPEDTIDFAITPFPDANIEPAALEFTGINPFCSERKAFDEADALKQLFKRIRKTIKSGGCNRAILVGHNAMFDLNFLNAAVTRNNLKRNPFHPFSSFDTATLAGLAFGQTVLAKACEAADINFDAKEAHSAAYDANKTAELFCSIVNRWQALGGWPVNALK
ncbi:ribonuclease T [Zooshikella sp. RANM57]|uniref:ribonuclease T n=1 Tax=Zooshikella sp. RANM57 TaxID=3425863 RepID=UPI003D6F501B